MQLENINRIMSARYTWIKYLIVRLCLPRPNHWQNLEPWRVDLITNATNWSAGTYSLLGYKQGEVEPSYENFLKNVHPDDRSEIENNFENALKNVQQTEGECRIIDNDGGTRYLRTQFEFELNEKKGEARLYHRI